MNRRLRRRLARNADAGSGGVRWWVVAAALAVVGVVGLARVWAWALQP